MIAVNWFGIIQWTCLLIGSVGSVAWIAKIAYADLRKVTPLKPSPVKVRSADAGPPPGAVEWVVDITTAMGASHASCILEALADGCCRDVARARRIEQLEAAKPVATISATTTEHTAVLRQQEPAT